MEKYSTSSSSQTPRRISFLDQLHEKFNIESRGLASLKAALSSKIRICRILDNHIQFTYLKSIQNILLLLTQQVSQNMENSGLIYFNIYPTKRKLHKYKLFDSNLFLPTDKNLILDKFQKQDKIMNISEYISELLSELDKGEGVNIKYRFIKNEIPIGYKYTGITIFGPITTMYYSARGKQISVIQSNIRRYISNKNTKFYALLKRIHKEREASIIKVQKYLLSIQIEKNMKFSAIVRKIENIRGKAATYIQSKYKSYKTRNIYLLVREQEYLYPSIKWRGRAMTAEVYGNFTSPSWERKINLKICPLRNLMVVYLPFVPPGKYIIRFRINGKYKIDPKLPLCCAYPNTFLNYWVLNSNLETHLQSPINNIPAILPLSYHPQPLKPKNLERIEEVYWEEDSDNGAHRNIRKRSCSLDIGKVLSPVIQKVNKRANSLNSSQNLPSTEITAQNSKYKNGEVFINFDIPYEEYYTNFYEQLDS